MLARILSDSKLQIEVVTDSVVLIQGKDAEHAKYSCRINPYDELPEQVDGNAKAEEKVKEVDVRDSPQRNRFIPAPPPTPYRTDDIPPPPRL